MKVLSYVYLFFLFITPALQAKEGFYCIPSMRSTWFSAEKLNGFVYVNVRNPMGYDYMPQFDGPISKATLPFQNMQFEDLKELGNEFTFKWPADKCDFDSARKRVSCKGPATEKLKEITAFSVSTIVVTEEYPDATYTKNRYRFSFDKDGNTYFASLDFFNSTCENLKPGRQHFQANKE